jgi:hypothetical protein
MIEEAFDRVKFQAGPCGITCATCPLGNGSIAETAKKTLDFVNTYGIKEWAPVVPEGNDLDWLSFDKTIGWLTKYGVCQGCENGGGPPDCVIRSCAQEKGFELCNQCSEVDGCNKFEWLGDYAATLRQKLKKNRGKSKEEWVKEVLEDF